jgi:hypothetical protein
MHDDVADRVTRAVDPVASPISAAELRVDVEQRIVDAGHPVREPLIRRQRKRGNFLPRGADLSGIQQNLI